MPKQKEQIERQKRRSRLPRGIFRRGLFRGLLAEIAREQGCDRKLIYQALYRDKNPRIIAIVKERMEQRKQDDVDAKATLAEIEAMASMPEAE